MPSDARARRRGIRSPRLHRVAVRRPRFADRGAAAILHHAAVVAGCISNPLNPTWRERELRAVVEDSPPAVLVVPESWRGFATLEYALQLQADLSVPAVVVVRGIPRPGIFGFDHFLKVPAGSVARRPVISIAPAFLL